MNGTIPEFYTGHESEIPKGYFKQLNPYKLSTDEVIYNIRKASKYARQLGKDISQLTFEEMQQFRVR